MRPVSLLYVIKGTWVGNNMSSIKYGLININHISESVCEIILRVSVYIFM